MLKMKPFLTLYLPKTTLILAAVACWVIGGIFSGNVGFLYVNLMPL